MPLPEIPDLSGRTIGGYLLRSRLGRGGMGVVYLAVQKGLGREVALKLLEEQRAGKSDQTGKRFLREAASCARMSHPNIVKVYDFGTDQGYHYYAMEVLRAHSLQDYLDEHAIAPFELVFRVARDMASAMEHYHPQGVIHRDLKPANIMLDEAGRPVLTDFGLVKDLGATAITREGCTVGTPYFMAPEMIRGQFLPASDIWQLGVVLYRMVCGHLPFRGQNVGDLLRQIVKSEPEAPSALNPDIPAALETLILNCLEKDPAVRYSNATELARDAASAARRATVARRREGLPGQTPPPAPDAASKVPADAAPAKAGPAPGRASARPPAPRLPEPPTLPMSLPSRPARGFGFAAAGALLLLALFVGWRLARPPVPAVTDLVCRAGSTRAVVEWHTTSPCRSSLEWGRADAIEIALTPEDDGGQAHKTVLGPLEPGCSYRLRVILPDGARSLRHDFTTPRAPYAPLTFVAEDAGLRLEFETDRPVVAKLSGGPGRSVADPAPCTRHALVLAGPPPGWDNLTLELPDATGEPSMQTGAALAAVWQAALLEPMAKALASKLAAYNPAGFLSERIDRYLPPAVCTGSSSVFTQVGFDGVLLDMPLGRTPHYDRFRPADPYARQLAGNMALHLDGLGLAGLLRSFERLAPDCWTARKLSTPTALALHSGLRKLAEFDYCAAFLSIPFETGVSKLLGAEGKASYRPSLPAGARSEIVSAVADAIWPYPFKEAAALKKANYKLQGRNLVSAQSFEVVLPDGRVAAKTELTLFRTRLETELTFRVEINGGPILDLRHEAGAEIPDPGKFRPDLSIPFDPRFLTPGRNRFRVILSPVAGTRYLGLKGYNSFAALGVSWIGP